MDYSFYALGVYPKVGQKVIIDFTDETSCFDFAVERRYIDARLSHSLGTVLSSAQGRNRHAWYILHEDGTIGIYFTHELYPTEPIIFESTAEVADEQLSEQSSE